MNSLYYHLCPLEIWGL